MSRISKVAPEFWNGLYGDIREMLSDAFGNIAQVGGISGNGLRLTERGESYDASAELQPYLSKRAPQVGDPVAYMRLEDGSKIVLGAISQMAGTEPDSVLVGDAWLPQGDSNYGTNAVNGSNASTSTYVTALTANVSGLPTGTYRAIVMANMICSHSVANGYGHFRLRADGSNTVNGNDKDIKCGVAANGEVTIAMADTLAGVTRVGTGSITITLEYRAATAGTVSARNPAISVILWRTA